MTGSDPRAEDESPTAHSLEVEPAAALTSSGGLLPGTLLASRYRIVRFRAQGGMGAVYEAWDEALRETVALKTVRPERLGQPGALERLKREIQLARRVTHPNACRIFEFGQHLPGTAQEVAFLTMELLPGETLAHRIARGPVSVPEALVFAEQMAAGLSAAHQAGVVHRDFKSANVILAETSSGGLRAVVSDFGLAQEWAAQPAAVAASVEGTLDYMSPEQLAGDVVTSSADVYSFGVVLYEMVTGRKPFTGRSAWSAAVKRLSQPPPPPSLHVPGLDPRWERVILRCLRREPSRRFPDVKSVAEALRPPGSSKGRLWRLALAASLLAGLGGLFQASRHPPAVLSPADPVLELAAATRVRRSVAVLGFSDLGGRPETAWLSTALSEMFTTELAGDRALRAVAGETVARARVELGLPRAESLARDTLEKLHANLGADVVVLGSYLALGSSDRLKLRLDLRAQDARTGEVVASISETGQGEQLFELVARAGDRLRQALGGGGAPDPVAHGTKQRLSARAEVLQAYAEGLDRLRSFDAQRARASLEQAIRLEPRFSLAHAALGEAWRALGDEEKARSEARLALSHSQGLPREERLLIEGRLKELTRDWAGASEIYRVLFGFFPDNLEYGLRLVLAWSEAGSPQRALALLQQLRRMPPPASSDPRLDLAEADVAQMLGDFQRQRDAARRAVERGQATGARLLEARARLAEAYAAGRLGLVDEARTSADAARALYAEAGDRAGLAGALQRLGSIFYQQGRLAEAEPLYAEARQVLEKLGHRAALATLLNNSMLVLLDRGDLRSAREQAARAVALWTEVSDLRGRAIGLANVAELERCMGRPSAALKGFDASLAAASGAGEKSLEAGIRQSQAQALGTLGRLSEALALCRRAEAELRRLHNHRYIATALETKGELLREMGLARESRVAQLEALQLRSSLKDRLGMAQSRLALARLDLEQGDPAAAARAASEIALAFGADGLADREAEARAVLAFATLAQGDRSATALHVQRARSLVESTQRPELRAQVELAATDLALAAGHRSEAAAAAVRARRSAEQAGHVGLQLEAELRQARAEADPGTARERLRELEERARKQGFERLARLAHGYSAS